MSKVTWAVCPKHGLYQKQYNDCPHCKPEPSKRSKKYGGVAINIPPNMRSVK